MVRGMAQINDGGDRINYGATGAMREPSTGKGRYDLLSPLVTKRDAKWMELGAAKYECRNWEKGIPWGRCIDSAKRHIDNFLMGMTDEDHLAAARWNLMAIMHYQELGMTQYDDLPKYDGLVKAAGPDSIRPGQSKARVDAVCDSVIENTVKAYSREKPLPARDYKIIAVDFDGCLCENQWPGIGEPNTKLIDELIDRQGRGDKLILWTCRDGDSLDEAVAWCNELGLYFDEINENLPEMNAMYGNDCRKIGADFYYDDKAVRVVAGE